MSRLDRGRKRVAPAPENLIVPAGKCPLSHFIEDYYEKHQQRSADYNKKNNLRDWIEESMAKAGCDYTCYIVGSTSNGFGTAQSDVDICLVVNHNKESVPKNESMKALKHTRRAIHNNGFHQNVELIPAKVPILRLNIKNVQIDINCNNLTGLRNTWLLNAYSASSPKIKDVRVKPLAMIIKKAAKLLDVNDPVNGTLSSYSINLMVIHYLQVIKNPILPKVQELEKAININVSLKALPQLIRCLPQWNVTNESSLGELLVGFFEYYDSFNFDKVISTRLGTAVTVSDSKLLRPGNKEFVEKSIRIEEPFDGSNTARACWKVDSFAKIKYALYKCKGIFQRCMEIDADIMNLFYNEMRVERDELDRFIDDFEDPRAKGYNRGSKRSRPSHTHQRFDESFSDRSDSDPDAPEFIVTDQSGEQSRLFVGDSSSEEEETQKGKKIRLDSTSSPSRLVRSANGESQSGESRYFSKPAKSETRPETSVQSSKKTEENGESSNVKIAGKHSASDDESEEVTERPTIDEGIGSTESQKVIDLTSDNDDSERISDHDSDVEFITKTSALDENKKVILKQMLLAKMAQQISSDEETSSEESVEEVSSDSEDGAPRAVKKPVKKLIKRRNKNNKDLLPIVEQIPQAIFPMGKDTLTEENTLKRLLEGDSGDEIEEISGVEIPSKKLKLPPPKQHL